MGSKKNKSKKPISPTHTDLPQEEPYDSLLDDLLSQLDSKNQTVQNESAQLLNEMQPAQLQQALKDVPRKQDSRSRYLARQAGLNRCFLIQPLIYTIFTGAQS
jgi:OTU domain-containing protein 6